MLSSESTTKRTEEEETKELKTFCLELASKQGIRDKGCVRDKTATEIVDDAEKFYDFISNHNKRS